MDLHVGTSGYSYPEWKGSFYPADLPAKRMLRYYAERFDTVEMNNTFYRAPTPAGVRAWAAEVPESFRFVLKAPQRITHFQRLKGAEESLAQFLGAAAALGPRLGPILFQLPPNMKKDVPRLRDFLGLLPASGKAAFEFRHSSWFDPDVLGLLRARRAALCLAEADEGAEAPFQATAPWGYLRLRRAEYADADLSTWARRVRDAGWSEVFVFFKHEDAGTGPRFARRFLELAGA
ncbi:MAG TPA: DUF72 domain-containing protein [Phycisphaerales bacterium]|nr:DUF72 domain-containing protein [Phycisphaerales bacterium]